MPDEPFDDVQDALNRLGKTVFKDLYGDWLKQESLLKTPTPAILGAAILVASDLYAIPLTLTAKPDSIDEAIDASVNAFREALQHRMLSFGLIAKSFKP